jgi:membrane-bound lytic murein transglycosylase D
MMHRQSSFPGFPLAALLLIAPAMLLSIEQMSAQANPADSGTKNSAQSTAAEQRNQTLIQQVEQAYASGEAAYHKGELSQARAEFDRAVDLMLLSGLDIVNDPELNDEFNHTLDRINALEAEALRQGTGLTPKAEATPSDVAEEVTFEPDPTLLAKARAELKTTQSDLPLVINEYVGGFINFFANTQKGHNTLLHSFQRAGRYRAMIQRIMAEEGVPQDLIYLAVAESGFQPTAVNRRSKAGGMWQFMPRGNYGLARNEWVDERFDPEKSTRAYARYMKFIYAQLGDWYLSMAAYDWGAGNVQRAVEKTGYADFWQLYRRNNLPNETKNYVPEILAAIIIAKNPTQYGFDDVTLDPPVLTDTISLNYQVDLRLVADIINVPVEELAILNPSLLRLSTPAEGLFDLHLPAGTATLYEQRVAAIPVPHRNAWRYHRLVAGETLASVARDYHLTTTALEDANQIRAVKGEEPEVTAGIAGPEALILPLAPVAAPSARTLYYTTRRGDTLVTIADRFGLSLDQLRRWNHLAGSKVTPGQRLRVAAATATPVHATSKHKGKSSPQKADPTRHEKGATTNGKAGGKAAKSTISPAKSSATHSNTSTYHPKQNNSNAKTRKK